MPIYEYACKKCGCEFEELIRGDEQPACPSCGSEKAERQMSAPAGHVITPAAGGCPARSACGMADRCGGGCGHAH